jgi:hypothetical protein
MTIIEPEFMKLTSQLDAQAFWDENRLCEAFTTQKTALRRRFLPG